MRDNMKLSQHAKTIAYYGGILFSIGLIWGGGMAALRGSVPEGLAAIILGILLQLGLKHLEISDRKDPGPDWRRLIVRDDLRDRHRVADREPPVTEYARREEPPATQARSWNRDVHGNDGATLETSTPRFARLLQGIFEEKERI